MDFITNKILCIPVVSDKQITLNCDADPIEEVDLGEEDPNIKLSPTHFPIFTGGATTYHLIKPRIARATKIVDTFDLLPFEAAGTDLLKASARIISVTQVKQLLFDAEYSEFAPHVGVLDLRNPNSDRDPWGKKIRGAVNFPVNESRGDMLLSPYSLITYNGDSRKQVTTQNRLAALAANWAEELRKTNSPFHQLEDKSVLIIHCRESLNRTPIFAMGCMEFFAEPRGQTIFIMKGGYAEYEETYNSDKNHDIYFEPTP